MNPNPEGPMNPNPEELLFQEAAALETPERAAYLDRVCAHDAALRTRLEALLAAHDHPETLLATPTPHTRSTLTVRPTDSPDPAIGQLIGRYQLLERLGEGGCERFHPHGLAPARGWRRLDPGDEPAVTAWKRPGSDEHHSRNEPLLSAASRTMNPPSRSPSIDQAGAAYSSRFIGIGSVPNGS